MGLSHLLRRGLGAGIAAGVASAVLIWLYVEPVIRRALVVEEARAAGHHGHGEEPLVSRTLQVVGGAATAVVVGSLFGVVFAVVFARARHRLPGNTDFARSAVLAALGFAVFTVMPALKIPANPPAVGDPATVTERTLIYLLTILLSLAVVLVVAGLNRHLSNSGASDATRYTLDMYAAVAGVAAILVFAPASPDTVPSDVPASLLWDFRLASLAQLAAMWAVLGTTFGMLVERAAMPRREVAPVSP